jgi:hypothetical protein
MQAPDHPWRQYPDQSLGGRNVLGSGSVDEGTSIEAGIGDVTYSLIHSQNENKGATKKANAAMIWRGLPDFLTQRNGVRNNVTIASLAGRIAFAGCAAERLV